MRCFILRNVFFLPVIAILSLLISCSTGRIITKEDLSKIQVGTTTKRDVVSALGLPNQRTVEGDKERWVYFKEASMTSLSLVTFDSMQQSIKSGVAMPVLETITMDNSPDVAAIVWLDQSGVVIKILKQGGLR